MLIKNREVLLYTPHGSNLYGLANKNSDQDFYAVLADREHNKYSDASQTIINNVDTTIVGYSKFLEMCHKGVPQALEALMSNKAIVDNMSAVRNSYVIAGSEVVSTYLRTIKNFTLDSREGKQPKLSRHAVRLAFNLNDIINTGRFNPELNSEQQKIIQNKHVLPVAELQEYLEDLTGYRIF